MKLLKRDFVPKETKSIKGYPLISGKAYFIKDDNSNVVYVSKEHVKELFPESEFKLVIDLTKGLIRNNTHNGGGNLSGGGSTIVDGELQREQIAESYLILTQEKLQNFIGYKDKLNNFLGSCLD